MHVCRMFRQLTTLFGLLICAISSGVVQAADMRLAVTTSFHNSGLSDVLLPEVKQDLGLEVHLVVVGTGQALKLGRAGDVDAILVHSRAAEEAFVSEDYGLHRREIMYNDFVLVGPSTDPANIAGSASIVDALDAIHSTRSAFVSRGDDSGTHRKERSLWAQAGLVVEQFSPEWYRELGSGMGATLNTASGLNAYVLSDRASWLKFGNKGELELLYSGDAVLFNQYAYLPVNPQRHPHVNASGSKALEAWLVGERGQKLIGDYKIDGQILFTANASVQN